MQICFNKCLKTCVIYSRNMSQFKLDKVNSTNLWNKPDLKNISNDYIGLPDNKSNLRPILRHQPLNETYLEHKLRIRRLEVEQFNQNFWSNHNKRFYDEKELFIAKNKEKSDDVLSADKMSEFYKYFLDKNWYLHFYYNISWYIKNFELLILSFQTNVHSFIFKKK